jgi:hypothetical protein
MGRTKEELAKNRKSFRARKWLMIEMKGGKCKECGWKPKTDEDAAIIEFDHRIGTKKLFNVAHNKSKSISPRLKEELDKCEMVCSNCHARRTYRQTQKKLKRI